MSPAQRKFHATGDAQFVEHVAQVVLNASDGVVRVAGFANDREPTCCCRRGLESFAKQGEWVGNDDSHGG